MREILYLEYKTIGVQAYHQGDYATAIEWLEATVSLLQAALNTTTLSVSSSSSLASHSNLTKSAASINDLLAEVYDFIAFSYFKLGDVGSALATSVKLLQLNPLNARIADNIAFYQYHLTAEGDRTPDLRVSASHLTAPKMRNHSEDNLLRHDEKEMADYRALCRGEVLYKPEKPLNCEYQTYGNPRLLLKPAKIEHLSWNEERLSVRLI